MKIRTLIKVIAGGLLAVCLAGCTTPYGEPNRTETGALIGGLGGAGLGVMLSHYHPGAGAVLGGAAGAIAGGLIGNSMDQEARAPVYAGAPLPASPQPYPQQYAPPYAWGYPSGY